MAKPNIKVVGFDVSYNIIINCKIVRYTLVSLNGNSSSMRVNLFQLEVLDLFLIIKYNFCKISSKSMINFQKIITQIIIIQAFPSLKQVQMSFLVQWTKMAITMV